MSMTYRTDNRGFAPIIIALIIAVVLGAAGITTYLVMKKKAAGPSAPTPAATTAKVNGEVPTNGAKPANPSNKLDSLHITAPSIEMPSSSSLPKLNASALNVSAPNFSGTGLFKNFTTNTSTSYSYKLDIPMPAVELTIPTITAPPTTAVPPTGTTGGSTGSTGASGAPAGSTGGTGSSGSTGTTGQPSQATVNAANCAQFSSMPSAQYCSQIPDPNGQTLCQQCKAAGL
jgi:hypothetical protein